MPRAVPEKTRTRPITICKATSCRIRLTVLEARFESTFFVIRASRKRCSGRTIERSAIYRSPAGHSVSSLERVLDDDGLGELAQDSLVELESSSLANRLRIFVQQEGGSAVAIERAEAVLEEIEAERVGEVVRNSVDYTYVREPADYTRKKENERD